MTGIPRLDIRLWKEQVCTVLCGPHFLRTKKMDLPYKPLCNTILNYIERDTSYAPQKRYLEEESTDKPPDHLLIPHIRDNCNFCGGTDLRVILHKDLYICAECGVENQAFVEDFALHTGRSRKRYAPRLHEPCYYKRLSHFRYWLKRLQGQEYTVVPQSVILQVKQEMCRSSCVEPTNYHNIRLCLKRLKYQKYYDNVMQIMCALHGAPLIKFKRDHELELCRMFQNLQQEYAKISRTRVNMLFYPYLIKKFCEIKGWWQVAQSIPMLKSSLKIQAQDRIWKQVCSRLDYPYYATI